MKQPLCNPSSTTRRRFLKQSLAVGSALATPWIIPSSVLGKDGATAASERITLGVIGYGNRCKTVLGTILPLKDVQCVALADVRSVRREAGKTVVDSQYGNQDCTTYQDFREVLERKDIDAVLIATGDRWHAMGSMLAMRAGKDVYSEKPCGITIADCQALADTARRYGRVFQAGTQRRSIGNFDQAVQLAHQGKLGKLHTLYASIYTPKVDYGWLPAEPEPPKDVVDWDMWLGPAPWRPYNSKYVAGRWRGYYDFDSGASVLDWGAHTLDLCQWANQSDDTMPVEYEPTPTSIEVRYASGVKVVMDFLKTPFGDRSPNYHTKLGTCPVRFVGDEGWVETGDAGGIETSSEALKAEIAKMVAKPQMLGTDPSSHTRNFFDCVRSRALTAANPTVMRHSHIASHAAAIAWMLNRKLKFDPATEAFIGDDEANRMRSRASREPWCA